VRDLQLIATGDELAAIPEAAGRFHGHHENCAGDQPDRPAGDQIDAMETALTGSPFHMIDLNHFRDKEDAGWRGIVNQGLVSAMGGRLSAFDTMGVRRGSGRCTAGEWGDVR
jgi:hypothetical protein